MKQDTGHTQEQNNGGYNMNTCSIMGRITNDLEIKNTQNGTAVLSFSVAVNRSYAKKSEERQADFIDCVAWRNTAEFIAKYFGKGRMIAITGELRTRVYEDKNGSKHKVTEIFIDKADFTGEAKQGTQQPQQAANSAAAIGSLADFEDVLDDAGVPF